MTAISSSDYASHADDDDQGGEELEAWEVLDEELEDSHDRNGWETAEETFLAPTDPEELSWFIQQNYQRYIFNPQVGPTLISPLSSGSQEALSPFLDYADLEMPVQDEVKRERNTLLTRLANTVLLARLLPRKEWMWLRQS